MKSNWKKLLSVVLAAALAVGLTPEPGTGLTAYADYQKINIQGNGNNGNYPWLNGHDWGDFSSDNDMSGPDSNGSYTKTYNSVPAGTYQFKFTDGSWANSWALPYGTSQININTEHTAAHQQTEENENHDSFPNITFQLSRQSNVTITFNPTTKKYIVSDGPVTGVSINKTSTTLTVGGTETLTATVEPDYATDKSVTWSSDNTAVATVANGVVTAIAAGTANITATATNGTADTSDDRTATCAVTVEAAGNSAPASDTAIDISNSNASGTHWSYDASTHTLRLDGYNYSGSDDGVTYSGSSDLTISLVGANSIESTGSRGHGICCRTDDAAVTFSGEGSLDVSATGNGGVGIYFVGDMVFAGGTVSFSGNTGIYNHNHHVTVSGGEVHATGTDCGVYTKNGGKLSITGGKLVATGTNGAIKQEGSSQKDGNSRTINSIAGTGWTDTEGTEGKADIPISTEGQTLTYKKVQFPADYVASVTPNSGGTPTNYTDFSTAVSDWSDGSTLTLLSDVTTGGTISVTGAKTLDLNGYGITMTGSDRVIRVADNANLTMKDSNPNATHKYTIESPKSNGAGLAVVDDDNGATPFTGGYITGGNCSFSGGGISVEGGTLDVKGGNIIGNQTTLNGAGVAVLSSGSFTMSGGAIIGNKANECGGGASVEGNSVATISGGEIKYNYSSTQSGGIHTDNAQLLTVSDGKIEYNYTDGTGFEGGGILLYQTALSLSGDPTIANNVSGNGGDHANNLYLPDGCTISISNTLSNTLPIGVTMVSPGVFTDSANTAFNDPTKFVSENAGYAVFKNSSGQLLLGAPVASVTSGGTTTNYTTFAAALTAWTNNSTLTLLSDVTTSSTISVSGTKTLDLHGHGITKTGGDNVIWITGGNLTVNDSDTTTTHYFDVNDGMAVNVNATSGEKSFSGGYITGGTGKGFDSIFGEEGGGVYVDGGSFTLCGGTILGNSVNADNGGGVGIYSGTMTMHGGTICYNKGYGVAHRSGSSGNNRGGGATTTDFVMYDGVIANNTKNGVISSGWWSYGVDSDTFYGGTIINNGGWGIHAEKLTIAGNVTVSGNKNGVGFSSSASISSNPTISDNTNSNLNVGGKTIDVTGALTNTTPIGVTMATPGVFTDSANTAFNDATKFVSDNSSYAVGKNADGQLLLGEPVTVTFDTNGRGTAPDSLTVPSGSVITSPAAPTETGYTFAGWNTKADGSGTPYAPGASLTLTGNLTLYAQWTSKPLYTVSGTVKQGGTAVSGVTLRLVQGEKKIAVMATNAAGAFSVSAPDGIYNIVAEKGGKTKTELVTLNANQQVVITMPSEDVNSKLTVSGSEIKNVMVGGLAELAEAVGEPVTVTMTVEEKAAADVDDTEKNAIIAQAGEIQTLDYLDIAIMNGTTPITDTNENYHKVLEIVVPYRFTGKENVAVYRYHDSATPLNQLNARPSGSYEDGKYYIDKANSLICIYASKFSTYAIGYTQCYNISGTIKYGTTYTDSVRVSLLEGETEKYTATVSLSGGSGTYSFTHVLAGTYTLRAVWTEDRKETTLNKTLLVQ